MKEKKGECEGRSSKSYEDYGMDDCMNCGQKEKKVEEGREKWKRLIIRKQIKKRVM